MRIPAAPQPSRRDTLRTPPRGRGSDARRRRMPRTAGAVGHHGHGQHAPPAAGSRRTVGVTRRHHGPARVDGDIALRTRIPDGPRGRARRRTREPYLVGAALDRRREDQRLRHRAQRRCGNDLDEVYRSGVGNHRRDRHRPHQRQELPVSRGGGQRRRSQRAVRRLGRRRAPQAPRRADRSRGRAR